MNSEEPLLTGAYDHLSYQSVRDEEENVSDHVPVSFTKEFSIIANASALLSISFFLQYFISVMAIYSGGKLGPEILAGVQLAVSTFNITANAIFQGMATSLDTLCPSAYGKKRYHDVGFYFQRCATISLCATAFIILVIFWNSSSILLLFLDDTDLAHRAQTYLRIILVGAPGLALFESSKRFLLCQHMVNPITYILLAVAVVNLGANYFLVWNPKTSLGYIGIPISVVISYWCLPLMTLIVVLSLDAKKCWSHLDLHVCFSNWGPMLRLAIPGIVMVEAEYLAFQVLNFFAATLGTIALASQSICSTIGSLVFQISLSTSVIISTRVGHLIGCSDFTGARNVVRIGFTVSFVLGLVACVLLLVFRKFWVGLFSDNEELRKNAGSLVILLAINQLFDVPNVIGAGVLRGQGRQRVGSYLSLLCYYVISLPLGYYFAFHLNMEVKGLWVGIVTGVFALAVSEAYFIATSNWEVISQELLRKMAH